MSTRGRDAGQATVEVALAVPLLMVMILVGLQIALVVRDQIAVIAAAREAARAIVVADGRGDAGTRALARTASLDPSRRTLSIGTTDGFVHVTVTYQSPTDLPLVGAFLPDITVHGSAVMAQEA